MKVNPLNEKQSYIQRNGCLRTKEIADNIHPHNRCFKGEEANLVNGCLWDRSRGREGTPSIGSVGRV